MAVYEDQLPREWPCPLAATPEGVIRRIASLMPAKRDQAPLAGVVTEVLPVSIGHAWRPPQGGSRRHHKGLCK